MKNIIQLSQQKRTFFCHQPNDEMLSFSDRNAFNTSIDSEANSTQIPRRLRVTHQIAQRLKVVAPVFPAVALVENSIAFNVCYECSEPLGKKGLDCSNCKEHFHFKCHVKPKYENVTIYNQKNNLFWKCSLCKSKTNLKIQIKHR